MKEKYSTTLPFQQQPSKPFVFSSFFILLLRGAEEKEECDEYLFLSIA
jgi:hypothetical protein